MKIVTVVGARPNFMKAAPLINAIRKHNQRVHEENGAHGDQKQERWIDQILVHTGQHYDSVMSDSFFKDLGMPSPDVQLGVGSGSHAAQTAAILSKFEEILLRERPDAVVVVGDVNSTVACALATAKIAFDSSGTRPILAHVEAGLRSFDRLMPEEVNRVVTDHLSDLLFVTEASGVQNLMREGLPAESIHLVGNTMIDSLLAFKEKAEASGIVEKLGLKRGNGRNPLPTDRYAVLTLHRPSNVDARERFLEILDGLRELASECAIVFPAHPRTQRQIKEFGIDVNVLAPATNGHSGKSRPGLMIVDPMGYLDFVCLMKHASLVVTDSGGIQEETTCLGVPCVTVRDNTERPVTIERGTNLLAGTTKEKIREAVRQQIGRSAALSMPEKWDGHAATRILEVLVKAHAEGRAHSEVLLGEPAR